MKGKKGTYTAAIIGTGRIGFTLGFDKKREKPASHTMALLENPCIKLVAGCDTFEESLNQWKRYVSRYNRDVKTYPTAKELLAAQKYDIIVIAVNEDSHLQTALEAIAAQPRLIILEKPVALNTADGTIRYTVDYKEFAWSSPIPFLNEKNELFVLACDALGNVRLVHGQTGKVVCQTCMGSNFESSPIAVGNTAVVGCRGGKIYKFVIQ